MEIERSPRLSPEMANKQPYQIDLAKAKNEAALKIQKWTRKHQTVTKLKMAQKEFTQLLKLLDNIENGKRYSS